MAIIKMVPFRLNCDTMTAPFERTKPQKTYLNDYIQLARVRLPQLFASEILRIFPCDFEANRFSLQQTVCNSW
jgi:hypothetical protein